MMRDRSGSPPDRQLPSMSETTTLLKAGATDLVLRMAEAGTVLPDLTRTTRSRPSVRSAATSPGAARSG